MGFGPFAVGRPDSVSCCYDMVYYAAANVPLGRRIRYRAFYDIRDGDFRDLTPAVFMHSQKKCHRSHCQKKHPPQQDQKSLYQFLHPGSFVFVR